MKVLTGSDWSGGVHALHVTVSRLRAKLGESGDQPRRLITVHGFGYRFEPDANDGQPSQQVGREQSAFILTARDRTILWASSNIDGLLGWTPESLEGMSLYDLIHDDDRALAFVARDDLDAGLAAAMMFRLRTNADDYVHVEAFARPLIGPDGTTMSFLGEFRPATSEQPQRLSEPKPIYLIPPTDVDPD